MRRSYLEFRDFLDNPIPGVTISPNADLSTRTSMRTRCRTAILAEVNDPRGLRELLQRAHERAWPLLMLGGGANMLFATSFFNGITVSLGKPFESIMPLDMGVLRIGAATPLPSLIGSAKRFGLMGLEFLYKVPGQVGGALAGNAGAGGWGICDLLERAVCMTRNGKIIQLKRGDFRYSYRFSELKELIVLEADIRLRPLDPAESERLKTDYSAKKKSQPYHLSSSGCIFKNVLDTATNTRVSTGKLIDDAGLKGYCIRDAMVSEGHGNFIVNVGQATGEDFLALISFVQDAIGEQYGVDVELEVNVVGGPMANVKVYS